MTYEEKEKIMRALQEKDMEAQQQAVAGCGENWDYYKGVVEGIRECRRYIRSLPSEAPKEA